MATSSSSSSDDALTDYERKRIQNIKRNEAIISALGILTDSKPNLQLSRKHEVKGYKRPREKDLIVTRRLRSSRIYSPDAEEKTTLDSDLPNRSEETGKSEATRESLTWDSIYISGISTQSFGESLKCIEEDIPLSKLFRQGSKGRSKSVYINPQSFDLKEDHIARLVPERIMSVAFLPSNEKLLLVVGDKRGHLGFWDVNCEFDGDGVHLFKPHSSPVSGISIAPFSITKVFSCSYDGTVKQLDVDGSMFDLNYFSEEDAFSAICSCNVNSLYVGADNGFLTMLDVRQKKFTERLNIHDKRINTIDLNQNSLLMVTSSTDATAKVWDVRKLNKGLNISKLQHGRAVHSAHFSPSGNKIATCSVDNTIGVITEIGQRNKNRVVYDKPTFIAHPNTNNRWISTFRAIWGWDDEYVFVPNMKRTIDVISTSKKSICHQLSSALMTSIPSRLAAHPNMHGILAGCSAGGQVYIWQQ